MFIRDMLGPDTYFYMGGNSWGVGIDYELDFKPDFSGAPFWLTACTSRVYGLQWTKDSFSAELRGLLRDDCEIVLHVEGAGLNRQDAGGWSGATGCLPV